MTIFTRLTFNENEWVVPSGHYWKESDQGKPNVPYENQHGFGHEEWLLNSRYNIDGWQYGYIRGFRRVYEDVSKVYLYSVRNYQGKNFVYYLGILNDVEVLGSDWENELPEVAQVFDENFPKVIEEVEQTNGNSSAFNQDPFVPVIRFKIDESNLLDTPVLIEGFPLNRYKRFQPYKITQEISDLFENSIIPFANGRFVFNPGKASQTERFNRYAGVSSKSVIKKHSKIIDELEKFLEPTYSLKKNNLSIEKTRFDGNIADIVTKEKNNSISIYEVKTTLNVRKNIREAIAQLLDYSSHAKGTLVNEIVIVTPCALTEEAQSFIAALKDIISFPIVYMAFSQISTPHFSVYNSAR